MNQLQILFYETAKEKSTLEVIYENETFWLSQKKMAELFGVEVNTINYHLKEIFKSGELDENSVIRKFRITANDGEKYCELDQNFVSDFDKVIKTVENKKK